MGKHRSDPVMKLLVGRWENIARGVGWLEGSAQAGGLSRGKRGVSVLASSLRIGDVGISRVERFCEALCLTTRAPRFGVTVVKG
eukprot:6197390-Pleurochrysis_carterae.AAC.1